MALGPVVGLGFQEVRTNARGKNPVADRPSAGRLSVGEVVDVIIVKEWILLLFVSLPLLFPRPMWAPVLLTLPLMWGLRWWRTGSPIPTTPLNVGLLVLALMLLASLWATFSITFSLDKISGLLFSLAVFFVVTWEAGGHLSKSLVVFLAGGLAIACLGLVSTDWPSKIPYLSRLTGQLPAWIKSLPSAPNGVHPNELGGVLILFLPMTVVLAVHGTVPIRVRRWTGRLGMGLVALFTAAVTLLTQSRSALLGLLVGLALLIVMTGRRARFAFAILVILGAVTAAWIGPARIISPPAPHTDSPVGEITPASRIEIWSRAVYGLEDFSIIGMGMGTFRRVAPVLYPLFTISPDKDIAHAHNIFLQTGLDLGLPGLIAYLSLWLGAFVMLIGIYRHSDSAPIALGLSGQWIALGLAGGLLAHLIFSITDAVALGARPGFIWWYMLGLVVGLYKLQETGGAQVQVVGNKGEERGNRKNSRHPRAIS
jgi:putative inorganic carbon (HCO3(-)) transporter